MRALIALAAAGCAAPRHTTPPARPAEPATEEAVPVIPAADPAVALAAEIQDPSAQLHLHIRGVVEVSPWKRPRMPVPAARATPYILEWRRLLHDPARGELVCMTADSHAFGCVQTRKEGRGPILLLGVCRGDRSAWRLASVTIAGAIDDLTAFLGDIYTRDCPGMPAHAVR